MHFSQKKSLKDDILLKSPIKDLFCEILRPPPIKRCAKVDFLILLQIAYYYLFAILK